MTPGSRCSRSVSASDFARTSDGVEASRSCLTSTTTLPPAQSTRLVTVMSWRSCAARGAAAATHSAAMHSAAMQAMVLVILSSVAGRRE